MNRRDMLRSIAVASLIALASALVAPRVVDMHMIASALKDDAMAWFCAMIASARIDSFVPSSSIRRPSRADPAPSPAVD